MRTVVVQRLQSLQGAGVLQLSRTATASPCPNREGVVQAETLDETCAPVIEAAAAKADALDRALPAAIESEKEPIVTPWERPGTGLLFGVAEAPRQNASAAPSLDVLRQEVAACARCDELARERSQTVFGVGNSTARVCFMGEAPGADEDRLGEPFVGRAGQLLNRIIEACKMRREEVYILNMIKCRPPGNRNPHPQELANCRPFLERQLELIRPEFICCLGAVAAQNLLNSTAPIGRLRGAVHAYRGAKVICTYHPAYLLRNPAAKKDAWDDMKLLLREMGMEL